MGYIQNAKDIENLKVKINKLNEMEKMGIQNSKKYKSCKEEIISTLSYDSKVTIKVLNSLDEGQIEALIPIFTSLSIRLNDINFINCINGLQRKFPNLGLGCIMFYSTISFDRGGRLNNSSVSLSNNFTPLLDETPTPLLKNSSF